MFRVAEVAEAMDGLDPRSAILKGILIVALFAAGLLVSLSARTGLRVLMRRAVRRAGDGRGRWTVRLPRPYDGQFADQRRVQRADATAFMLARMTSVVVLVVVALAISHVLRVDPVVLLSSAGFIGAGIAIGGQTIIKDWLAGLLVLLDDRYAVGDLTTMRVGGNDFTGTVEILNGAGVRLRLNDGSTWHAGHGSIESVINFSQKLVVNEIEISPDVLAQLDETMVGPALNAGSHDLGLTDIVLLPDLTIKPSGCGGSAVTVLASRQLNDRQLRTVRSHIENRDLLQGRPVQVE